MRWHQWRWQDDLRLQRHEQRRRHIEFSRQEPFPECIPTGWYPAGLVLDEKRNSLYVANVKGTGSRNMDWKGNAR